MIHTAFKEPPSRAYCSMFPPVEGKQEYTLTSNRFPEKSEATDLITGEKFPIDNHQVRAPFDFQWQVRVLKVDKVK